MPIRNLSVLASSPFIQYTGDWTISSNTAASSYNANTSFLLQFFGTAIYVHGIIDTGTFSTDLDGQVNNYHSANDWGDADVINATNTWPAGILFVQEGLSAGNPHHLYFNSSLGMTVTLVNITTGDGLQETLVRDSIIEDSDNNVTYTDTKLNFTGGCSSEGEPLMHGGSACEIMQGAYANISFYGNEIAVYSFFSNGLFHGGYNVSLDGHPPLSWGPSPQLGTKSTGDAVPNVLLSGGLSDEAHYVVVTNTHGDASAPVSEQVPVTIDYATVSQYVNNSVESTTAAVPLSTAKSVPASTLPVGAITGAAFGGAAFVLLSLVLFFIALRWRHRQARDIYPVDNNERNHSSAQAEEDTPQVDEDSSPPEYQHVFPALRAISLRVLAPAWAVGSPRRKRGRVVVHPNHVARPPTHSTNVANPPRDETPQTVGNEMAQHHANADTILSNAAGAEITRKAKQKNELAGHNRRHSE